MNYREFKRKQEEEANNFTENKIYYAFGVTEEEVIEKLAEYNVKAEDVVGVGSGAYILKDHYEEVLKFFNKQATELKEYTLANINDVLTYEFANYELEISLSYTYRSFLIEVLDFTEAEIEDHKEEINKAINDYRKDFYEHN